MWGDGYRANLLTFALCGWFDAFYRLTYPIVEDLVWESEKFAYDDKLVADNYHRIQLITSFTLPVFFCFCFKISNGVGRSIKNDCVMLSSL